MAEQRLTEAVLERALTDLGADLAYPPTPRLDVAVRARIATRPPRRTALWWLLAPMPRALALMAVVVLVAGVLLALSAGTRSAVADLFGLRGVRFFSVESSATPVPASTAGPEPTVIPQATPGARLVPGVPVPLEEAQGRVTFPIRLPSLPELGTPDAVLVGTPPPGGQVSLVYGPRPGVPEAHQTGVGLLITQFRGEFQPYLEKGLARGSRVEQVSVAGARGYWIAGEPHTLVYRDPSDAIFESPARLAGNTLLWERDGVTYRLESALGRDQAVRIAESFR